MNTYKLKTPLSDEDILKLRTGDVVLISGVIYTARDAAHKRLIESIDKGEELPFPIKGRSFTMWGRPLPPLEGQ